MSILFNPETVDYGAARPGGRSPYMALVVMSSEPVELTALFPEGCLGRVGSSGEMAQTAGPFSVAPGSPVVLETIFAPVADRRYSRREWVLFSGGAEARCPVTRRCDEGEPEDRLVSRERGGKIAVSGGPGFLRSNG